MLRQIVRCGLQRTQSSCVLRSSSQTAILSAESRLTVTMRNSSALLFRTSALKTESNRCRRSVTTASREELKNECSPDHENGCACRYPHRKCWKCATETLCHSLDQLYFCGNCKFVQAPVECLTHFDLFNLPRRYEIDSNELRHQFRQLQSVLHPDKFSQASDRERAYAAEQSAFVNRAYTTLKDAVTRAEYCLQLEAVDLESLRGVSQKAGAGESDAEFLMYVMETSEAIEEAANSKDRARLTALRTQLNEQLALFAAEFGGAYARFNATRSNTTAARRVPTEAIPIAAKMRYLRTMIDQVEKVERDNLSA